MALLMLVMTPGMTNQTQNDDHAEFLALKKRVIVLESKIKHMESMEEVWNTNVGTELGHTVSEQAILDELLKLKAKIGKCCP